MPCCGLISSEQPIGQGASPDLQLSWGYSLTLGGRWYMEDYHTAEVKETSTGSLAGCFAIYDGHGGRQCVQFVKKRLFKAILATRAFSAGDIPTALYEGYMEIDEKFSSKRGRATCGSTSTTVLVHNNTLYVAHCGDSRAVLVTADGVQALTRDHKPSDPHEAARIEERGGHIVDDDVPRVCGVLAVTRAFGNNSIKSTVNAEPEVSEHNITPDFQFVVIASDGVWDVLSNEDVAALIREADNVRTAAEDITLEAYRLGSSDNISAVVLALNFTGPIPITSSLVNAVRNFSNRGVPPNRDGVAAAGGPNALTTTFDTSMRGGRSAAASATNGATNADKGGATSGASSGQDPHTLNPSSVAVVDPRSRTPPHSPLSDAVGYNVSPPAHERSSNSQAQHDQAVLHAHFPPPQHMPPQHSHPHSSGAEHASLDTAAPQGAPFRGVLPLQQHPDSMQGGALDPYPYEYEYEDDGVIFEGNTPDSATYAANNSPDAEARYWERLQSLPPEQGGFADHPEYGVGYDEYAGGEWGYGGYEVSRWGALEDIAEEGESNLSGSQHMPGSSGSFHYSRNAHSNSMDRPQRSRGDRHGGLQRAASPKHPSPRYRRSPNRHQSPPLLEQAAANGAHLDDPHRRMPAPVDTNLRKNLPIPEDDNQLVRPHGTEQVLEAVDYGAVRAHAQQYNSDLMGDHAYQPQGSAEMHAGHVGSWDGSMDRHSNDAYSDSNHNSSDLKRVKGRSSPGRSGKGQTNRRTSSVAAEYIEGKFLAARDTKHSVSGSSFMSQKSSVSQPVSTKSSRSDGEGGAAPRVRRPSSGSPTRSSKQVVKRPPFKF